MSAGEGERASIDPFDVERSVAARGLLGHFCSAGVLVAADVHVALRIGELCGQARDEVLLAAALAVRGPRHGHVCTDLATVASTATSETGEGIDVPALPWPSVDGWLEVVADSPLVALGEECAGDPRPLRLLGSRLYLHRYWLEERAIADDLQRRCRPLVSSTEVLERCADEIFAEAADGLQRQAALSALQSGFTVIAGGPGTGKTTTVAHLLALMTVSARATGDRPMRVALAAPTGKAAARLEEAVHAGAGHMAVGGRIDEATRQTMLRTTASTLHRLLGWRPDSHSRFRHDATNPLPHDLVIIDETSMVSASLMAKLLAAVRPDARLVLVGDPDQLASVEAGAVLGDIVGPARVRDGDRKDDRSAVASAIVVLRQVHRFGGSIERLAGAVQAGDADGALEVLSAGDDAVRWVPTADVTPGDASLADVRAAVVEAGRAVVGAARAGDGAGALDALRDLRMLCAHRRGPAGVSTWMSAVERWLGDAIDGYGFTAGGGAWYVGRPVMIAANDYGLRLYNGDTGVVVEGEEPGEGVRVAFERRDGVVFVSPARLEAVDTVHAMTIHKAQGSQFGEVVVLLPEASSALLTRELFYTGLTRAERRLTVVGPEASVRAAVERPVARASGLEGRLWV